MNYIAFDGRTWALRKNMAGGKHGRSIDIAREKMAD
jgi:hypothetical protein